MNKLPRNPCLLEIIEDFLGKVSWHVDEGMVTPDRDVANIGTTDTALIRNSAHNAGGGDFMAFANSNTVGHEIFATA